MRKIILNGCTFDKRFADSFINEWYRHTTKTLPHFISITFNSGELWEKRIGKEIDYLLDLLYQSHIIRNPIKKLLIDVDERRADQVTLEIA